MDPNNIRTTVAVIDLDENSNRAVTAMLQEIPGVDVNATTRDWETGIPLIRKLSPNLVILNLYPSEELVMEFAKKITQVFPGITLLMTAKQVNSNTLLNAMRLGVKEFLVQPLHKDELTAAVKKALQAKKEPFIDTLSKSKMFAVFGAKGGVGTTTVATNLAAALARPAGTDVVVVDMNFQFGDAALLLNVKTKYSILDVANHIDHIDVMLFKDTLPKGVNGVSLLAGPPRIEEAESITCSHMDQLFVMLRKIANYVVVDTSHVLNDLTIKALDESDHVLMVSALDVPSIYNTTRCLDLFQKMGYGRDKVLLVLNRYNLMGEIDSATMEKLLDYPIFWRLPSQDLRSMADAVTKGVPISKMMPKSKLGEHFLKMGERLNGAHSPAGTKGRKRTLQFLHKMIK